MRGVSSLCCKLIKFYIACGKVSIRILFKYFYILLKVRRNENSIVSFLYSLLSCILLQILVLSNIHWKMIKHKQISFMILLQRVWISDIYDINIFENAAENSVTYEVYSAMDRGATLELILVWIVTES